MQALILGGWWGREAEESGFGEVLPAHVLIVSIGALENGPIAPEIRPMIIVCQLGRLPELAY